MKVSVLMAAYNSERYVTLAVESILSQDYDNFEFVIVDDGSNDATPALLKNHNDSRIRVFTQSNQGLASALNYGLEKCTSEIVIRMDADDIAFPHRFTTLLEHWAAAGKPDVFGSAAEYIDQKGGSLWTIEVPIHHSEIFRQIKSATGMPFIHPSVLFKKSLIIRYGGYDVFFSKNSEDFDLWLRLSDHCRFGNTSAPLLKFRLHPGSTTAKRNKQNLKYTGSFLRLMALQKKALIDAGEFEFWESNKELILGFFLQERNVQLLAKKAFYGRLLSELKLISYSKGSFAVLRALLNNPLQIIYAIYFRYSGLNNISLRDFLLTKSQLEYRFYNN